MSMILLISLSKMCHQMIQTTLQIFTQKQFLFLKRLVIKFM